MNHLQVLFSMVANLIHFGVNFNNAYQWSRTRIGGWAVAQSPILVTTLEWLRKRGYEAMLTYNEKIAPSQWIGKPLYTACPGLISGRTVRIVA